jgi:hypothetical protein
MRGRWKDNILVFLALSKFMVLFFITTSTNVSTEITRITSITIAYCYKWGENEK